MTRSQISHMEGFSPTIGHFYVPMETNNQLCNFPEIYLYFNKLN